jgi:hypothetical protein
MRVFEVFLNGKRQCVAGLGDDGVMTVIINHTKWKRSNTTQFEVGGFVTAPIEEHVKWRKARLKPGDELRVKLLESKSADKPRQRERAHPGRLILESQKRFVREMAKKFGWTLTERPT